MSNETIKQWREKVRWPWNKKPVFIRKDHHRFIMEIAMIIVTALAAFATAYGAWMAGEQAAYTKQQVDASREQIEEMKRQVVQVERNKAFIDLLKSFETVCAPYSELEIHQLVRFKYEGMVDNPRIIPGSEYNRLRKKISILSEVRSNIILTRTALRVYSVWLPNDRLEDYVRFNEALSLRFKFFDLPENLDGENYSLKMPDAAKSSRLKSIAEDKDFCRFIPDELIALFYGRQQNLKNRYTWLTTFDKEALVIDGNDPDINSFQ